MRHSQLPCFSPVDFFRFKEDELISALSRAVERHVEQHPESDLSVTQEALLAWSQMSYDVPNGGFTQFFFNHRGDRGVGGLAALLDAIEVPKAASVVRDALAVFHKHRSEFAVANPWEELFGSIKEFDKLDRAFMHALLRSNRALDKWIRGHITELATDELGTPIDPQFTGTVESKYSNGLVSQYLEVKKGKPHGAYREFFDDGTVRKVIFYKSGKLSGDFWPDGNLKRKESTRGKHKIIEWFYPSGRLLKRYVHDKDGWIIEPVRLFHENGQLAEEVNVVMKENRNEKCGPWLKFFDDGSPRLQAEYAPGEQLVVHNAWTDDRKQVVKDGSGLFRDDAQSIDWAYDVYFPTSYNQTETDLENGVPHGKKTLFFVGVLHTVSQYVKGVREGEETVYWNNGRIRSVAQYVHGKAGRKKEFPKFDHPVPAVLLTIEANEKLYTAWEHMKVDDYPRVLNLDAVRRQLVIPGFLREVHERNLAKAVKSDYEDWNTFDDGIAYFLIVNESGEVRSATANGSGVYSGGNWDTYPPLLRKLQFSPGRIRGRAVECRVLARVDHTFVEASRG
jgi:antitoxin component YwqK of YwqJK toxin-antitoxin module